MTDRPTGCGGSGRLEHGDRDMPGLKAVCPGCDHPQCPNRSEAEICDECGRPDRDHSPGGDCPDPAPNRSTEDSEPDYKEERADGLVAYLSRIPEDEWPTEDSDTVQAGHDAVEDHARKVLREQGIPESGVEDLIQLAREAGQAMGAIDTDPEPPVATPSEEARCETCRGKRDEPRRDRGVICPDPFHTAPPATPSEGEDAVQIGAVDEYGEKDPKIRELGERILAGDYSIGANEKGSISGPPFYTLPTDREWARGYRHALNLLRAASQAESLKAELDQANEDRAVERDEALARIEELEGGQNTTDLMKELMEACTEGERMKEALEEIAETAERTHGTTKEQALYEIADQARAALSPPDTEEE